MSYSLRDLLLLLEAQNNLSQNNTKDINVKPEGEDGQLVKNEVNVPEENQEINNPSEGQQDNMPNDADYLMGNDELQGNDFQTQDSTPTIEKQKSLKLFNLFVNLKSYGETFSESLDEIDLSLIESENYDEYLRLRKSIDEINEKISVYIRNIFIEDSYKKQRYMFILLRTELLTLVKCLRRVLGLNTEE